MNLHNLWGVQILNLYIEGGLSIVGHDYILVFFLPINN
jgi:hypothetical protein